MKVISPQALVVALHVAFAVGCEAKKTAVHDAGASTVEADASKEEGDAAFPLDMLPFSVEMYSWRSAGGEWCFTFVPVTSRRKSPKELTPEPIEQGFKEWVCGIEPLKQLLSRFRKGQKIYWQSDENLIGTGGPAIAFPDGATIRPIVDYARSLGLDFHVMLPGYE